MEMASITNEEIIYYAAVTAGLDPSKEYFTYNQWKLKGYQVQKGSKAVLTVGLWTPTKASKKQIEEGKEGVRCYLKTSALFTKDQVAPIEMKQAI